MRGSKIERCHVRISHLLMSILYLSVLVYVYCAPVGVQSIVINPSVCLSVCLSVREHISGTALPIVTNFFVHIPRGRGSVLLRRRCDKLCTFGFMDDVTCGRNGRDAGKG